MVTNDGIDLMEELGGSFVKALAEAWCHADKKNKQKLEDNFSYFEDYSKQAAKKKHREFIEAEAKANRTLTHPDAEEWKKPFF